MCNQRFNYNVVRYMSQTSFDRTNQARQHQSAFAALMLIALSVAAAPAPPPPVPPAATAVAKTFVGSAACESCHRDQYSRWKDTLMARVVLDPAQHPDAVIGDFPTPQHVVNPN